MHLSTTSTSSTPGLNDRDPKTKKTKKPTTNQTQTQNENKDQNQSQKHHHHTSESESGSELKRTSSSRSTLFPSSSSSSSFSSYSSLITILTWLSTLVSAVLVAHVVHHSSDNIANLNFLNLKGAARFFDLPLSFSHLIGTTTSTASRGPAKSIIENNFGAESWKEGLSTMTRTPVYFLSHGGPNIMYNHDHPAYRKLQELGREITTKVKPRAIVVFSAHWQGGRDYVQVNTAESTDLIYDFYGFPSHYYKEQYPHVGSKEIAQKVLDALKGAGIKAEGVKRGLDHGVWASFKCAFDPDSNPLNVPIVQVSLFKTEDPIQHYRLGQAVSKLREENIQIIVSGMAVHNLRDMQFTLGDPTPLPYTVSFDEALKDAVTTAPEKREQALVDLLKRPDARMAHPYFDHLLPIHVGAGAAGDDVGKRLWTLKEGSMSWAQFRFGEPAVNGSL